MQVVYEDNHIIAVNKACGEVVQGDKTGDETVMDVVKLYLKLVSLNFNRLAIGELVSLNKISINRHHRLRMIGMLPEFVEIFVALDTTF